MSQSLRSRVKLLSLDRATIRRTTAAVGSNEKTTAPAMMAFCDSRSIGNTYTMVGTAYPELAGQGVGVGG